MARFLPILLLFVFCNCKGRGHGGNSLKDTAILVRANKTTSDTIFTTPCDEAKTRIKTSTKTELDELASTLQLEKLIASENSNTIPKKILHLLECLLPGRSPIANPGQPWNAGCTRLPTRPDNQLISIAQNDHWFLMNYRTGGFTTSASLIIIHYSGDSLIDFRSLPGYFNSLNDHRSLIRYLQSSYSKTSQ